MPKGNEESKTKLPSIIREEKSVYLDCAVNLLASNAPFELKITALYLLEGERQNKKFTPEDLAFERSLPVEEIIKHLKALEDWSGLNDYKESRESLSWFWERGF